MTLSLPQSAAPLIVLGWTLQRPGDGLYHAVIAIAETGDITTYEGALVPQTSRHCFHDDRDASVFPRCPRCEEAAGDDRKAQGARELAYSATYSRQG